MFQHFDWPSLLLGGEIFGFLYVFMDIMIEEGGTRRMSVRIAMSLILGIFCPILLIVRMWHFAKYFYLDAIRPFFSHNRPASRQG